MDRKAYIQAVLSALHHVTGDERAAIQAELDGHIEDHMEGLLELGYSPELAEERTLDAMGDPKEVGRELNKQYTGWGFVLLSRAAVLLTVVLCIQALLGLGILGNLLDSVWARVAPLEPEESSPNCHPYAVYGSVNDPRVTTVELTVRDWEGAWEYTLETEIQTAEDGHRFFFRTFEAENLCDVFYRAYGEGVEATGKSEFMSLQYDWSYI